MEDSLMQSFQSVFDGVTVIKDNALNRHDPDFAPWHLKARSVLLKYLPIKIPTFDEIPFASDFLLSKPGEEQLDINDRIALVSDLDLAIEIFQQAQAQVEVEMKHKKARGRIGGASIEIPTPQVMQPAEVSSDPAGSDHLDSLVSLVESLNLTSREKDEALEELERVQQTLGAKTPDWDRIKRSLKFFMDFDRTLALSAIPAILERYQRRVNE